MEVNTAVRDNSIRDPKIEDTPNAVVPTNVMDKHDFEKAITPVFKALEKILARSFGPYGSNAFITSFPYVSTTKDGWTIMKNIRFKTGQDAIIAQMAKDICGRLNNTVGDGTTSSIIATNAMYESYKSHEDELLKSNSTPRDILRSFKSIEEKIVNKLLSKYVKPIDPSADDFIETMRNIIYISTNGDQDITDKLVYLYEELKFPSIDIVKAADGVTKTKIIDGYSTELHITDQLYMNTDNNTAVYMNCDVIMFDHKVSMFTYKNILQPINEQCRARGRHLLVIAPFYDERALDGVIKSDLVNEYRRTKDINMVLSYIPTRNKEDKLRMHDLAMILNTTVIGESLEDEFQKAIAEDPHAIFDLINLDNRLIPGITIYTPKGDCIISDGNEEVYGDFKMRLGFADYCEIGINTATFRSNHYDERLYNVHIEDAKAKLNETIEKYRKLGTFNLEISSARHRLNSLKLKMGVIEVGGDSQLSQDMLQDAVDDAVKAAASAFNNGIVLGCHVNLHNAIEDVASELSDGRDAILINIISDAFAAVYRRCLANKFVKDDSNASPVVEDSMMEIIKKSYETQKVYDLTTDTFTDKIINSAETDIQILRATIDLISLLISGNQLVYIPNSGGEEIR